MCNVFEVAKKLCEASDWNITNLQLQKMLYISQVLYLGLTNHHLFRGEFQAWDYGPVAPKVYHQFKIFGDKPIEAWAFPPVSEICNQNETLFIDMVAKELVSMSASKLVGLTHRPGTGWYKNYTPGARGREISEDDMKQEYKEVWLKNAEETN